MIMIDAGDAIFHIGLLLIAVILTIVMFHYNGVTFLAFVSGLFWFIVGFFFLQRAMTWDIFRMVGILSLGMAFACFFSPLYSRAKHEPDPPPDNLEEYKAKREEYKKLMDSYKSLRRR